MALVPSVLSTAARTGPPELKEHDMTTITHPADLQDVADRPRTVRLVCAAASVLAVVPFALASFPGDSGAEVTDALVADATTLQLAGIVAVLAAAGLFLAAVRLGDSIGGLAGRVTTSAGTAVALMFGIYYATFAAAGVVATQTFDTPGAGLGESALLVLNVAEIARYAPGLVVVVAAVAARGRLSKGIWIPAAVLGVLTLTPFTSWIAALLIPLWLGLAAAFSGSDRS